MSVLLEIISSASVLSETSETRKLSDKGLQLPMAAGTATPTATQDPDAKTSQAQTPTTS